MVGVAVARAQLAGAVVGERHLDGVVVLVGFGCAARHAPGDAVLAEKLAFLGGADVGVRAARKPFAFRNDVLELVARVAVGHGLGGVAGNDHLFELCRRVGLRGKADIGLCLVGGLFVGCRKAQRREA